MKNIADNIKDREVLEYLDYLKYERRLSYNTIDSYGENLKTISDTLNKSLISLNTEEIRCFLQDVNANPRTKAHYLTVFNSFYNYLIFLGKIDTNPCDGIKSPKVDKKLPNYLTEAEIDKLFNIRLTKPTDYRNKAMLEVMYATGARVSELINLELSQIDYNECVIRVSGKGKKDRIIPLGDTAMSSLTEYIGRYRSFLLKDKTNNYVFLNKDGERISRQGFFKILKSLCATAGIDKEISPHTLRHSFATSLLNNGADLRVVQELLGHENLETTEIYSHISNQKIKDDYENHPHAHIK